MQDIVKERARWVKEDAERQLNAEQALAKAVSGAATAVEAAIDLGANRDPLSGAPGSHPIGTVTGAAGGATAGAVVGTAFLGPVGFVAGGIAGALIGGLAGKGAAEGVNPTDENAYWRDNYKSRPYVKADVAYHVYQPAYQYGWESRGRFVGRPWDEVETDLRTDWEKDHGQSELSWGEAGPAARDAWERVDRP
jgi:hypothetical protein